MSVTKHRLWPELRPYVLAYTYRSHDGTRFTSRFDMRRLRHASDDLLKKLRTMSMQCVRCGREISPIRVRVKPGEDCRIKKSGFYLSSTCSIDVDSGCSRSRAATAEASTIIKKLPGAQIIRK